MHRSQLTLTVNSLSVVVTTTGGQFTRQPCKSIATPERRLVNGRVKLTEPGETGPKIQDPDHAATSGVTNYSIGESGLSAAIGVQNIGNH